MKKSCAFKSRKSLCILCYKNRCLWILGSSRGFQGCWRSAGSPSVIHHCFRNNQELTRTTKKLHSAKFNITRIRFQLKIRWIGLLRLCQFDCAVQANMTSNRGRLARGKSRGWTFILKRFSTKYLGVTWSVSNLYFPLCMRVPTHAVVGFNPYEKALPVHSCQYLNTKGSTFNRTARQHLLYTSGRLRLLYQGL